jgi:hypothetical protein
MSSNTTASIADLRAIINLWLNIKRWIPIEKPIRLECKARMLHWHHWEIFHARYVCDTECFDISYKQGVVN